MFPIIVALGRWQGAHDAHNVPDLEESTLRDAAIKSWDGAARPYDMSSQVLIWDGHARATHNLIAVYIPFSDKLVMIS